MTRYFSASICYDPQEGGWTYYIAAATQTEARVALEKHTGFDGDQAMWEERRPDEVVTIGCDDDTDEIVLGTLNPGEVIGFTW